MTWWLWLLFWAVFWTLALTYLAWRTWKVWPHARDFGRTCSDAWQRLDAAREQAHGRRVDAVGRAHDAHRDAERIDAEHGSALVRSTTDDLAWNRPAHEWRAERAHTRRRRRELRLDDHAEVWASWRDPLD